MAVGNEAFVSKARPGDNSEVTSSWECCKASERYQVVFEGVRRM
jgi:hypothetical protein